MQVLCKCKRFGTQSLYFPSDSDIVICAPQKITEIQSNSQPNSSQAQLSVELYFIPN